MSSAPKLISAFMIGVTKSALFKSFPTSLLAILLEVLADYTFLCPCDSEMNTTLTGLIFCAPACFAFALTFLFLLHAKEKQDKDQNDNENEYGIKTEKEVKYDYILISLIPSVVWIIGLFFDGEYIACSKTDWEGLYVFDDKLKIKWCKPTELIPGRNQTELQGLTLSFIGKSQVCGYVLLLLFSIVIITVVAYYMYYNNGKKPKWGTGELIV
ncbi:hypothetical protein G5714_021592 [Onychostoma macrolepis]|uniref:Uncharacterized protein n=1 Tax=Onychostoma macrolepis TaxID=369639 RepID=A0A7J6BRT4_9TELE|nr:hypothetical protein G5714_021592 [Onychostoma macrolepis]